MTGAVLACPRCGEQHEVPVNGRRQRVRCGALAEAFYVAGTVEARVWPPGREKVSGQWATVVSIKDT